MKRSTSFRAHCEFFTAGRARRTMGNAQCFRGPIQAKRHLPGSTAARRRPRLRITARPWVASPRRGRRTNSPQQLAFLRPCRDQRDLSRFGGRCGAGFESKRNLAFWASGPWHSEQRLIRIGSISREKSTAPWAADIAPNAARMRQHSRQPMPSPPAGSTYEKTIDSSQYSTLPRNWFDARRSP